MLTCSPLAGTRKSQKDICACVGELGKDLDIAPSTVSHHIKELKQAGIIRMERKGQTMECSIDQAALRELKGFLDG